MVTTTNKRRQLPFGKFAAIGLFIALCAINFSSCENATRIGGRSEALSLQAQRSAFSIGQGIPIDSAYDLSQIGVDTNYPADGNYELGADITLGNWAPICDPNVTETFTGTFDGAGHTITVTGYNASGVYIGVFATSSGATFANLTVNLESRPITTDTAQYSGGLVAYATGTTFTNVTITGTFDVAFSRPIPPAFRLPVIKNADTFHALIPAASNTTGFSMGGVAGYAGLATQFRDITTNANLVAASTITHPDPAAQAPVFMGGVAGFTDGNTTITRSVNSGNIAGNATGYNTSAGGIAGYVVYTQISNSSSSGAVNLTGLGVRFDWNDSWQIDAGGLVGYAGGSSVGSSSITHCFATGNVSATAPFPYAGGLLGYAYGFNDFTAPASNGTLVSKCYATGEVISTSQPDPNGKVGDIPYAGGLVGYSSVVGSQIQDSYARGNVIAETEGTWAWGGGVVGGNANNAVVSRTYATGDVTVRTGNVAIDPDMEPYLANDPGPASGGIAGFNYYTPATPAQSVYVGLNWDFGTIWTMGTGGYPALQ